MPTYEYACTDCGTRIEVVQRIDDEPLRVCDVCGGALRKVFFPAGIVFKGSGFYATDSRRSPASDGKAGAGADRAEKSEGTAKGAGGSKGEDGSKPRDTSETRGSKGDAGSGERAKEKTA